MLMSHLSHLSHLNHDSRMGRPLPAMQMYGLA